MAEDDNSWVFDSLVCFLNGPIWDAPIQNFIEEKSLIFEPNNLDNEEDYYKIYEEYKNLVDFMLGNFMEDIGITPSQFEYACLRGHEHKNALRFDQSIFEQIWAANNFEMFKRMMTQRNVELQLQALELIEQKYGIMPQSFIPAKKHPQTENWENVPHQSNYEEKLKENMEKVVLTEVAKKFPEEEPTGRPEIEFLMEEKQLLEDTREKIHSEITKSEENILEDTKNLEKKEESKIQTEIPEKPITKLPEPELKTINVSNSSVTKQEQVKPSGIKEIDQMELKKRQEYLRMQRDKLVALKKEERKKQFEKSDNKSVDKKLRPKSAKAAETVLTGETSIPSQELQLRRALAERLKNEVVNKSKN